MLSAIDFPAQGSRRSWRPLLFSRVAIVWRLAAAAALAGAQQPGGQQTIEQRGEYLARAGDCVSCHTATGGAPFAGGLRLDTPFGYMLTPNITPDPDTGIGRWSSADFYRALHDGVNKRGQDMYPTMPYDFYTKATRADIDAIYAYLQDRQARRNTVTVNHLYFPVRPALVDGGVARALFHCGRIQAEPRAVGVVESRRLPGRRPRPLQRLPFAAQPHGRHREEQGFQRRGDRRLVRARPHVRHCDGPRLVDGGGDRDVSQDRRRTKARRPRWDRWRKSCGTA